MLFIWLFIIFQIFSSLLFVSPFFYLFLGSLSSFFFRYRIVAHGSSLSAYWFELLVKVHIYLLSRRRNALRGPFLHHVPFTDAQRSMLSADKARHSFPFVDSEVLEVSQLSRSRHEKSHRSYVISVSGLIDTRNLGFLFVETHEIFNFTIYFLRTRRSISSLSSVFSPLFHFALHRYKC